MTQSERERLATLETKVDELIKRQEKHEKMLVEVRDAVVSVRGARWAIVTLVGVSGTVGGLISQFFPK